MKVSVAVRSMVVVKQSRERIYSTVIGGVRNAMQGPALPYAMLTASFEINPPSRGSDSADCSHQRQRLLIQRQAFSSLGYSFPGQIVVSKTLAPNNNRRYRNVGTCIQERIITLRLTCQGCYTTPGCIRRAASKAVSIQASYTLKRTTFSTAIWRKACS